jgi:hypothetical protein
MEYITHMMPYLLVNETSQKDTLYYLEKPSILFILEGTKIKHTVCGETAGYLYKLLSANEEKKKNLSNVPEFNKIFYSNLLNYMDIVTNTVASYETTYLQ